MFAIAPIVEGHGEIEAVPVLLRRIFIEMLGSPEVDVLRPIRIPRSKLVRHADLLRAISLADLKLKDVSAQHRLILVLFDADDDLPCRLAPDLLQRITTDRPELDVTLVLATPEYETWFVAAAESLTDYLDLKANDIPDDPEVIRAKKAWLQHHFRGRYTETIEQPALTARMDLQKCRSRSASFDKLCRELERRFELRSPTEAQP